MGPSADLPTAGPSIHRIGVGDSAVRPSTPSPLPSYASSPRDLAGRWLVALTRSNAERSVVEKLDAADIGFFLPLQDVIYREPKTGKKRRQQRPLFAGYVFACVSRDDDGEQRFRLGRCDGVWQLLDVAEGAQPRLREELAALHIATASGMQLDPYPGIVVGARCAVIRGPFRGAEGDVIYRDDQGKHKLILQVTTLGRSVGMEIDPADVEPI